MSSWQGGNGSAAVGEGERQHIHPSCAGFQMERCAVSRQEIVNALVCLRIPEVTPLAASAPEISRAGPIRRLATGLQTHATQRHRTGGPALPSQQLNAWPYMVECVIVHLYKRIACWMLVCCTHSTSIHHQTLIASIEYTFISRLHAWLRSRATPGLTARA